MSPLVVDPDRTTVNDLVALRPETLGPLSRLGIDTCCGGSLTLRNVAHRHGLDLSALLDAVGAASAEPEPTTGEPAATDERGGCSCGCGHGPGGPTGG